MKYLILIALLLVGCASAPDVERANQILAEAGYALQSPPIYRVNFHSYPNRKGWTQTACDGQGDVIWLRPDANENTLRHELAHFVVRRELGCGPFAHGTEWLERADRFHVVIPESGFSY